MVTLLSAEEEPGALSLPERAQWMAESLVQNLDRMQRLEALLPLDEQQRRTEMQQSGGEASEERAQLAERYVRAEVFASPPFRH